MTTKDRVLKVISDVYGVDVEQLRPDMRFIEDLGGDSLDASTFVFELEDELGFRLTKEEEKKGVHTVEEAVLLAEAKAGSIIPSSAPSQPRSAS